MSDIADNTIENTLVDLDDVDIEGSPQPAVVSVNGIIMRANQAAAQYMGVDDPSKLIGLHGDAIIARHQHDELQKSRLTLNVDRQIPFPIEFEVNLADGQTRNSLLLGVPCRHHGERAILIVPVDTTGLHQSIVDLHKVAESLDAKITDRSAELVLLNSEIDAAKALWLDARQQLEDADYLLHTLFSLSRDAILHVVGEAIKEANSAAAKMFGYDSPEEMVGRSLGSHIDPSFVPIIQEDIASNDYSRWQSPQCVHYIRKDGSKFIGEVTVNVSMKHGIRHAIGIIRDITERQVAQDKLKESQLRLEAVLRASQTGVWDLDVQSRTIYCSPECLTMLEYEPDELDNQLSTWESLIHPEELDNSIATYAKFFESKADDFLITFRLRTKSGSYRQIVSSGKVIERDQGGLATRIVGTHVDATTIYRAQEAVEQSEARYRALFELSPDGIMLVVNAKVSIANPAMARILGHESYEALIGTDPLSFIHPKHHADVLNRIVNFSEVDWNVPVRRLLMRVDGVEVETEMSGATFNWSGDNVLLIIVRNITERLSAEAALQDSQEQLELIMEASNTGAWDWNVLEDKVFFSSKWKSMLGYEPDELESEYGIWSQLIHPEDRESAIQVLDSALGSGKDEYVNEFRMRTKSGEYRHIVSRGNVLERTPDGRVARIAGTHIDVTAERRAQEELKRSEERYRALFELSPDGITVILDEKIIVANKALVEMLGFDSPNDLIGTRPWSHSTDEFSNISRSRVENLHSIDWSIPVKRKLRRRDGTSVPAEIRGCLLEWGGKTAILQIIRDISVQEESERLLIESEERYRAALAGSDEGVWDWNTETGEAVYSRRWREIIGYDDTGLEIITEDDWRSMVHPDDIQQAWEKQIAHMEGKTPNYEAEFRMKHRDGHWVWVLSKGKVTDRDANGKALRIVGTHTDISDRKLAEEKIAQLNRQVTERALELENAVKELESFSYSVSHDLRGPLRSIDGFSAALSQDYDSVLDETGKDYLRRVRAAAQRMGQLIDDLLNLSRVSRRALDKESMNLSKLAERVFHEVLEAYPGRAVESVIAPNLKCKADPGLIQIVLQNLFDNAIKFSVHTKSPLIEFGAERQKGETVYFVRDNGPGFSMEHTSRLFNPFERLHNNPAMQGHGIGLATVARIIERHGGRIWADSKPKEGACFYFTLGSSK